MENNEQEELKGGIPVLVYGAVEGPNTIEIGGMVAYEVIIEISTDGGETNYKKGVVFPDFEMCYRFMKEVNLAPEPVHMNFYNDPDFPDEVNEDVFVPHGEEDDNG